MGIVSLYFAILYNKGAKSSSQMGASFFNRCLPIAFTMFVHVSDREFFFHEILANLPYNRTEIVGYLKTFKMKFFFLKKMDGFFGKKLEFFHNQWRCESSRRMRIKYYDCLEMSFLSSLWRFFGKKSESFQRCKNWKEIMKKECFFFEKKCFQLFKSLPYRKGRAQNLPVVFFFV